MEGVSLSHDVMLIVTDKLLQEERHHADDSAPECDKKCNGHADHEHDDLVSSATPPPTVIEESATTIVGDCGLIADNGDEAPTHESPPPPSPSLVVHNGGDVSDATHEQCVEDEDEEEVPRENDSQAVVNGDEASTEHNVEHVQPHIANDHEEEDDDDDHDNVNHNENGGKEEKVVESMENARNQTAINATIDKFEQLEEYALPAQEKAETGVIVRDLIQERSRLIEDELKAQNGNKQLINGPRKGALATSMDGESVREAYNDIRADNTETQWAVFKYDTSRIVCSAKGVAFDAFKEQFDDDERAYGYIRLQTGDEMSKRHKFLFVTWIGPGVSVLKRAKMSIDKAIIKNVISNFAVELQLETQSEFDRPFFIEALNKASGANYGTGVRDI